MNEDKNIKIGQLIAHSNKDGLTTLELNSSVAHMSDLADRDPPLRIINATSTQPIEIPITQNNRFHDKRINTANNFYKS
jgi:hypothetical protein